MSATCEAHHSAQRLNLMLLVFPCPSYGKQRTGFQPLNRTKFVESWIEKLFSLPDQIFSMLKSVSGNSVSSRWENWYPFLSYSCASTLESTSSRISIVLCRSAVLDTLTRRLFGFCLRSEFHAAGDFSSEQVVILPTRSFKFGVTKFGPKSSIQ